MNEYVKTVIRKKVERTMEALACHGFNPIFVESKEAAFSMVTSLVQKGDVIGVGGSMTLKEVGLLDEFQKEDYHLIQTQAEGLTLNERHQLYRECFFADVYLSSANAITEDGYLYNVDGRSNRVAALLYGPNRVIIVAGINKIVRDLDEAIKRNREVVAPANALRLNKKTPCTKTLKCCDCKSADRICRNYVVMGSQADQERITIILVNDELGF